jgi:quercetin dioxygenase-like cupin family protein
VRIELLLDHCLRPRLLASGLMLRLELLLTGLTDPDDWDILDALDDPKSALGHDLVSHRYGNVWLACVKLLPKATERSQSVKMAFSDTFIDTSKLPAIERLPGWRGRYFDSPSMTFAHYEFDAGSSIHEHFHSQEEVYHIIEGELELTIGGATRRLGPGFVGVVPSNTPHAVKAISSGKVIIVDYPLRDFSPKSSTQS